jgi:hypothetical protein
LALKWFKRNIEDSNIFFYKYNNKSERILDLFGDYKLTKVYLIRQPLSNIISFTLNLVTFFQYEKLIAESKDNFPYHTLLVFEVLLPNKTKKMILLEKNNCINLSDNFLVHSTQETIVFNIKKKDLTLNHILQKTCDRIGNERFFNWNLYKNNCQEFTKEILDSIGIYTNKSKEFIFRDKMFKLIVPSEITLHIGNCFCVIYNIIQKYIYDNDLFTFLE